MRSRVAAIGATMSTFESDRVGHADRTIRRPAGDPAPELRSVDA